MGEKLTRARIEFVDRHHKGHHLIDIGIGGGRFVLDRPQTFGYDINPDAVRWLKEQSLYAEPWALFSVRVLTFWDSFEHIPDPSQLLARTDRVFMSIPIFESREHALSSKHYKPGEHVYYFTHDGLVRFMRNYGFTLVEANTMESDLGREGIESFYFRRT